MELPSDLISLYRHWEGHTTPTLHPLKQTIPNDLAWFVRERMRIWEQKVSGKSSPYTDDHILAKYRFCNIFREFDRQTIEFHTMLNPLRDNFPLWLINMFYCRMVARTETINTVGLLALEKRENAELYERLMKSPRPRYGTPYVFPVSTILRSATPTRELFLTTYVPSRIPEVGAIIRTWNKRTVYDGVRDILPVFGHNLTFLWTEVLIDVAYQFPEYIDLFGRFPIGPGALPTFKNLNPAKDPTILVTELARMPFTTGVTIHGKPLHLSAENWEGVGCEFRKYTNLSAGKGRKRIYDRQSTLHT